MNASQSCRHLARRALIRPSTRCSSSSNLASSTNSSRYFRQSRKAHTKANAGSSRPSAALLAGAAALASLALTAYLSPSIRLDSAQPQSDTEKLASKSVQIIKDTRDPSLPRYRLSDIRKHDASSSDPWVMHGDKVYNIKEWLPAHPGGEVILRAAGGSIEPYWNIFTIHKTQYVYDILEQYLIGYVHMEDLNHEGKVQQDAIEDPFAADPIRHKDLIVLTERPQNAETPANAMAKSFITPNDLFYVRNHMWVPTTTAEEAKDHPLTIELEDGTLKRYTLDDLKTKFKTHEITATLQCSGNRRRHMSEHSGRKANGLQWSTGAISTATWEGVLLSDLLSHAGFSASDPDSTAQHIQFSGEEAYGASIPLRKAIDPQGDVLLAFKMNGEPLPRDHGFPLRAIVPGHVAARSVKWLKKITVSDEESESQWQRRDYKCFGPNETDVDWDAAPAIQELPVQSAITKVKLRDESGSSGSKDRVTRNVSLSGYAYSGGGRAIIRVDISTDNGKTWSQARLLPESASSETSPAPVIGQKAWAWKRWQFNTDIPLTGFTEQPKPIDDGSSKVTMDKGGEQRCTTLVVKATDDAYNTQPESHAATWNVRGNLATAWHRVQVCTDCSLRPDLKAEEKVWPWYKRNP